MILSTVNPLLLLALTPATEMNAPEALTAIAAAEAPAAIVVQDADATADATDDPKWTGSANLGAVFNSGNTESTAIAASIDAELRREKDRQTVGLYWNYAENDDVATGVTTITERRAGADYKYDYFITDDTYYLANAGANTDSLAQLDLRWFAGAGVGRQFYDEEEIKFNGEAGLVYLEETYETSGDDNEGVSARLAANFFKQMTETTVLEMSGEIYPSLKDSENIYGKLDSRVKVDVNENLFAQLQWVIQWDNTPASGSVRTDNQIIATLGWGF